MREKAIQFTARILGLKAPVHPMEEPFCWLCAGDLNGQGVGIFDVIGAAFTDHPASPTAFTCAPGAEASRQRMTNMTIKRFIIVQEGSCALFGAFSVAADAAPAAIDTCAILSLDEGVVTDLGGKLVVDRSVLRDELDGKLVVYAVPSEVEAYDHDDLDASDTGRGKRFEGFNGYARHGVIVPSEDDEIDEKIAGEVAIDGTRFAIEVTEPELRDEGAILFVGDVQLNWIENGIAKAAVYSYAQWVNEGKIERIDCNDGWDYTSGDKLPSGTREDMESAICDILEESDFDLRACDTSRDEADAAPQERDPDLFVVCRDPARDHFWQVGRNIDGGRAYLSAGHHRTLRDVVRWAEDDRNFEEGPAEDAA